MDTGLSLAATRKMLAEPHKPTDLIAETKAKILYDSCLHHAPGTTEDTAIFNAVSDRFSRWPLAHPDHDLIGYDLETFLIEAIQIGAHPLFTLKATPDIFEFNLTTKSTKRRLHVSAPVLGLSKKDYASFGQEPEYRQIYADTIFAAARRFNVEYNNTTRQEVMDIVAVEETLAMIFNRFHEEPSLIHTTLDSVDSRYGQLMNWTTFVKRLAALPYIDITDIAFDEPVHIKQPNFLDEAFNFFIQLPERTQANYIIWRVVESLQNVLVGSELKLDAILQHAVLDNNGEQFRDEACTHFVSEAFHLVVHRLLYAAHLPPKKLQQLKTMVKQMQEQFIDQLASHSWLDQDIAQVMEDKIKSITTSAMYLTEAMNSASVEAYYSTVVIYPRNFINNVIATRKDDFDKNLRSFRTFMKIETEKTPHILLAQFSKNVHEIFFTSNVLQPPFFMDNAPMVLNYAGTGFVLGHELAHAVDLTGSTYYTNGTDGLTWNVTTWTHFVNRLMCMVDQYGQYLYKPAGEFVHGYWTLSENIADNLAIQLAYRAYTNYTRWKIPEERRLPGVQFHSQQLFFLRHAQIWCRKETGVRSQYIMQFDTHSPREFS